MHGIIIQVDPLIWLYCFAGQSEHTKNNGAESQYVQAPFIYQ
jgi:hypothetical protein